MDRRKDIRGRVTNNNDKTFFTRSPSMQQTVIRSPTAQYGYSTAGPHNLYPNMQGVYPLAAAPGPLQVDPYQSPHHTPSYQTSPYHQQSPSGSYHSPQELSIVSPQHVASSPHHLSANQMGSPHGSQMMSPSHYSGSPHAGGQQPMGSPPYQTMAYPPSAAAMTYPPTFCQSTLAQASDTAL